MGWKGIGCRGFSGMWGAAQADGASSLTAQSKNGGEMSKQIERVMGRMVIGVGLVAFGLGGPVFSPVNVAYAEDKKEEKKEAPPAAAAKPAPPAVAKPAPPPPPPVRTGPTIFDLDPFLVNLADTAETRFAKITIKLESRTPDFSQSMDEHIHQVRDSLLLLISSKRYSDIRTVEGKLELRDNIVERVNAIVGEGKATAAYFTDFVVQ